MNWSYLYSMNWNYLSYLNSTNWNYLKSLGMVSGESKASFVYFNCMIVFARYHRELVLFVLLNLRLELEHTVGKVLSIVVN